MQSEEEIINPYFVKFVDCVNNRDIHGLYALFSDNILYIEDGLAEQISATFSYFPQYLKIKVDAHGFSSRTSIADGERRTEIDALFIVTANEQEFYAAMKICSEDTTCRNNVGILSIYFISAQNYHDPLDYRGDGKWTPGIHLE